ncbi:MAG: zinc-binding dehydrogenase, partial [Gemmatimonadales bacterium]
DRFAPDDDLRGSADVVGDLVGGPYVPGTLDAAAPGGRIVVIGLSGGRTAEVDLGVVLRKRLAIIGTVLRSRSTVQKREVTRAFADEVLPLFRTGAARPLVDRVFDMRDVAAAHRYMEGNENFGSVVLAWGGAARLGLAST